MDGLPNIVSSLVNALQGAAQAGTPTAAPQAALLALAGQDVSMQLLYSGADGTVSLALPNGQVITAQGQLPYPDGTQLLLRILPGGADAPVQLQTLQATPPAPPAILGPLYQGEAGSLLASLGQADPPPALAPLAELFQLLGGGQAQGQATSLPAPAQIQAALDSLPAAAQAALKTALDLPQGASQADTAQALSTWLAAQSGQSGQSAQSTPSSAPAPRASDPAQALVDSLVQQLQTSAARHPDQPAGQADTLAPWLRKLVDTAPAASPAAAQSRAAGGAETPAQTLQTLLAGRQGAPAEQPQTWETWMRASIKALADPQVSPQGAAFHAAQAKEGTAYFELPLPWSPQSPLQVWVESDRNPGDPDTGQPETHRVLLGLHFSNLGETRLGIAKRGQDLQVRVWTEHPELLAASREAVAADLEALGGSVDLKVLPLSADSGGTIPTVRSQVAGATLQALG